MRNPLKPSTNRTQHSRISVLPIELLLMVAYMLDNSTMLKFLTAFKNFHSFASFQCLLKLKELNAVSEIWPLQINKTLNPEECLLVHEGSLISRSVEFSGYFSIINTLRDCNINQIQKVKLVLLDSSLKLDILNELVHLHISTLCILNDKVDDGISGTAFARTLGRNEHLKTLKMDIDLTPTFRSELFASMGNFRSITKFVWGSHDYDPLSIEEYRILGVSLKSTLITTLEIEDMTWTGFLQLTESIAHTEVRTLTISSIIQDEYYFELALQVLDNIAKTKVRHLDITGVELPNCFAILLSITKDLKLSRLTMLDNKLTVVGITALLQMDMTTLKVLDLRRNIRTRTEKETLRTLKPPHLKLML